MSFSAFLLKIARVYLAWSRVQLWHLRGAKQVLVWALLLSMGMGAGYWPLPAQAQVQAQKGPSASAAQKAQSRRTTARAAGLSSAQIEAQLHAIYAAIANADNRQALHLAEQLTRTQPNFQLGQMLYADLLLAQTRPVAIPGSAPEALTRAAPACNRVSASTGRRRPAGLSSRRSPGGGNRAAEIRVSPLTGRT